MKRWDILRRPFLCAFKRIPALVAALCRLHNFCIENSGNVVPLRLCDIVAIRQCVSNNLNEAEEVRLGKKNHPLSLVNAADGIRSETRLCP